MVYWDMFSKKNIQDIPVEETLHASGTRRLLVSKTDITSKYFEALTYGYMPPKEKYAMHNHENIDEICIVVKGSGIIRNESGDIEEFKVGDRFVFPSNTNHEIENTSNETDEFYFFRLLDK